MTKNKLKPKQTKQSNKQTNDDRANALPGDWIHEQKAVS